MAILYVVATPIGNLQDLSPRGAETLRNANLIIAEDTRVTMKLCQIFGIKAPLVSCHRHSENSKAPVLARKIKNEDLKAALVTDAGTPCISDPGGEVVRACVEAGIPVIPVPGCCAGIAAVSVSGFDAREFAFYGFPPRGKKDIREKLREIAGGVRVAILHESPFRIKDLTEAIAEVLPTARLTVCCDLTKLHENVVMDLHEVMPEERKAETEEWPMEARIIVEMKKGMTLREAQEALITQGEKRNNVKQAALMLKKLLVTE